MESKSRIVILFICIVTPSNLQNKNHSNRENYLQRPKSVLQNVKLNSKPSDSSVVSTRLLLIENLKKMTPSQQKQLLHALRNGNKQNGPSKNTVSSSDEILSFESDDLKKTRIFKEMLTAVTGFSTVDNPYQFISIDKWKNKTWNFPNITNALKFFRPKGFGTLIQQVKDKISAINSSFIPGQVQMCNYCFWTPKGPVDIMDVVKGFKKNPNFYVTLPLVGLVSKNLAVAAKHLLTINQKSDHYYPDLPEYGPPHQYSNFIENAFPEDSGYKEKIPNSFPYRYVYVPYRYIPVTYPQKLSIEPRMNVQNADVLNSGSISPEKAKWQRENTR